LFLLHVTEYIFMQFPDLCSAALRPEAYSYLKHTLTTPSLRSASISIVESSTLSVAPTHYYRSTCTTLALALGEVSSVQSAAFTVAAAGPPAAALQQYY
jgi:hypothetical protein